MRHLESRERAPAQPPQDVPRQLPATKIHHREVVVAGRVRWRGAAQVRSPRPKPATFRLQVADRSGRPETDYAAGGGETPGEVSLEAVGGVDKVFVEAADRQGAAAAHGKVAGHDVRDDRRRITVETEFEIREGVARLRCRQRDRLLAPLEDLAEARVTVTEHSEMASGGGAAGDEVVIEKEKDVS